MGIQRHIPNPNPDWPVIAAKLRAAGESPILRMIDGLPAFPDEAPEPTWKELRVGLIGGMITIRKAFDGVTLVSWGTEDPGLAAAMETLAAACA
jgi:hypothetical protein